MHPENFPELQQGNVHIFVQAMDSESGMALREEYLGQFPIIQISGVLNCNSSEFRPNIPVYIEEDQLSKLRDRLEIGESSMASVLDEFRRRDSYLGIVAWGHGCGALPYRLHTGRELLMMIDGIKPLSVFIGRIPADDSFIEIPEHLFDPHVDNGTLVKREIREMHERSAVGIDGHRVVLYARTGEEWRLDAYTLVRSLGNRIGWSEPLIRLEGTLLGYQDCQNDAYIAQMKASELAR